MTLALSFPVWVALFEQLMRPSGPADDSSPLSAEGESIFTQTAFRTVDLWNWLCAFGGLAGTFNDWLLSYVYIRVSWYCQIPQFSLTVAMFSRYI